MKRTALFIASILALAATQAIAAVRCGDKAPAFTLPSAMGGNVSLSDASGHYVVLEWFNHNCPFVHKFYEGGTMQKWQADAVAKGVVWYVIDSTNPAHEDHLTVEKAKEVYGSMHLASTALLLDETGATGRAYGATNTPQIFIIDPQGVLIYQGAVDDKRTSDSRDIAGAHNHLLHALDEALAGKPVSESATRPYGCSVKYAK
jgi:peroxiredoxin